MGIIVLKVLLLIELSIIYIHVVRSGSPATTVQQPDPRFAGRTVPPSTPSARERECGRFPSSNDPINTRRSNALCPVPIIFLHLMSVAQNCSAVVLYMLVDREYHDTNRSGRKPRSNVNPGQKCACVMGCGGGLFFFNVR